MVNHTKNIVKDEFGRKYFLKMQVLLTKGFDDICNFGRPLIFLNNHHLGQNPGILIWYHYRVDFYVDINRDNRV